MSASLPNKSVVSIASAYDPAVNMTALSNASEAVATLEASHGVVVGDILEVTSGWSGINGRIVRASAVATNDVTFEGLNTANTNLFPAGSGIGSVKKITSWTQITQILSIEKSGGEPQFANYSFLENDDEYQIPTGNSPQTLTLSLADDQSLPWYNVLDAATLAGTPRAIRIVLPTGAILFYNGYPAFNKSPSMTRNEVMALSFVFSLNAAIVRYAS